MCELFFLNKLIISKFFSKTCISFTSFLFIKVFKRNPKPSPVIKTLPYAKS